MANKTIPVEDKEIVIQRMAEGASTRQAIQDTSITSNSTAAQLAKQESNIIAQKRAEYVGKITHYMPHHSNWKACMLADMVNATKYVKGSSGHLQEVPDWDMRLKAIKYIDYLDDINPGSGVQFNVLQQVNN